MLENKKVIEIKDLTFANNQGDKIFDSAEFSLFSGQTAIIKGQTGSGKTTLNELIMGRKRPESGSIEVLGARITQNGKGASESSLKMIRRKIGGVGGIFQPVSYRTVYENMRYPMILRGLSTKEQRQKIETALSRVNLIDKQAIKVSHLSQGELNLLMLARAIVADQPLLLIDEPLAGLDIKMTDYVGQLLNRLSIAGHSILILTGGKEKIDISSAIEYDIKNGKIV